MKYVILFFLLVAFVFFYRILKTKYAKEDPTKEVKTQDSVMKHELKKRLDEQEKVKQELLEDPMTLSGEHLLLRPVKKIDVKPLSVVLNSKKVTEPLGLPTIKRVSQLRDIVYRDYLDQVGAYTITMLSTGNPIGLFKLSEGEDPDEIEGLFFIGRQYHKHGFSKELLNIMKEEARVQGYKILVADILDSNTQAQSFLKSQGFVNDNNRYVFYLDT